MIEPSCHVRVNWEHFRHNIGLLMKKGHELMPVIKADAYGHGVKNAAAQLEAMGVTWAAAGTLQEASVVRDAGFSGHIVALLSRVPDESDVRLALGQRLTPLIHNWEGLRAVKNAARSLKSDAALDIAVKVDTGMGRLGFTLEDMEDVATFLAETPELRPIAQISHLAVADVPGEIDYTRRQSDVFYRAAAIMRRRFPDMRCSLGNTAGLAEGVTAPDDLCRPGIALYGYDPLYGTEHEGSCGNLLPVMEVSAPLISVHPLRKGESLGYGRTYVAPSDRLVGWVAIGYADGYRRNPAPDACMCVRGERVPVIGRVAMQMTCVDLSELAAPPSPGENAYILGGPGNAVTAQELADWWGTIPYEVTCLLGKNRTE
ncbi:alanine racemase [Mailhella sp.]|uniref:alanine racemase n=1 Tax=Mailhella sp. TaxID=1981029 RepID=UPI003AB454E6